MITKVLFVCLGNICRSPSAEAVFKGVVEAHQSSHDFEIDSAGTSGYHAGEPADARMRQHASKRGYRLTSISRKFDPQHDFDHFDLIIAMDDDNLDQLKRMARHDQDLKKLSLMTDYAPSGKHSEVPDPYYGGPQGFDLVLDILEEASEGLFAHLSNKPS